MGCELTEADAEAEYVEIQEVQVSTRVPTRTHAEKYNVVMQTKILR